MQAPIVNPVDIANTAEFLRNPISYDRFSMHAVECIDPREPDTKQPILTAIQSPGGGAGVHIDRLIYDASKHRSPLPDAKKSLTAESLRSNLFFGAHYLCAFIEARKQILGEMVNPSDFTQETQERYIKAYDPFGIITNGDYRAFDYGVKAVEEKAEGLGEYIHEEIDSLTEDNNVVNMKKHKAPYFYVVSHDPLRGLNRQKMHRDKGLTAQAYFDNLGALLRRTVEVDRSTISRREVSLRMLAAISRTAATRTIINEVSGRELEQLEIVSLGDFFKIREIEAPKLDR
jgi:hypothetical protein